MLVFVLFLFGNWTFYAPDRILDRALRIVEKKHGATGFENLPIEPGLPDYSVTDRVYKVLGQLDSLEGFLVVSSAMGRFDPFDFMILFNRELEINDIRILAYSSDFGGGISSKGWLSQFVVRPSPDSFHYGINIDGVSGGTLSSKSLILEVNRISRLMKGYEK